MNFGSANQHRYCIYLISVPVLISQLSKVDGILPACGVVMNLMGRCPPIRVDVDCLSRSARRDDGCSDFEAAR